MDTNAVLMVYILCLFIEPNFCLTIDNKRCNCDNVECRLSPIKVSRVCRAFKGSFVRPSVNASGCDDCCAKCVIKKSLGHSCLFSGVNEIVVKCEKHLYCDTGNGFICLKKSTEKTQKYFPKLNNKDNRKDTVFTSQWVPKAVLQSLNISQYNQLVDKTRLKRSPIKIGFGGSSETKKKKKSKIKITTDETNDDNSKLKQEALDDEESEAQQQQQLQQQQQQQPSNGQFTDEESKKCGNCDTEDCRRDCRRIISKQVKMIKGGHSNSINQNSGPTFIVNNNYYGFRGGKLTKLKSLPKGSRAIDVKMDKEPIATKQSSDTESADNSASVDTTEKIDDYPTEKPKNRKIKPKKKLKLVDESSVRETLDVITTTTEVVVTKKKKLKKIIETESSDDETLGQPVDRSLIEDSSELITVTPNKPTKASKRIFYRRLEKTVQEDEGYEGENGADRRIAKGFASNEGVIQTKNKKTKTIVSDNSDDSSESSEAKSVASNDGLSRTKQKKTKTIVSDNSDDSSESSEAKSVASNDGLSRTKQKKTKTIVSDSDSSDENSEFSESKSQASNEGVTRAKTKKTKTIVTDNSDENSDSSESVVRSPKRAAKPASPKSKSKHKVTVITDQRYGQDGKRTRTTYLYDGDEWIVVDINGEVSDGGLISKEDLKLLNEKIVNPQKNDKAVVNIEEVSQ